MTITFVYFLSSSFFPPLSIPDTIPRPVPTIGNSGLYSIHKSSTNALIELLFNPLKISIGCLTAHANNP